MQLACCVQLCRRFSDDRRQKRHWHHLDGINKRWSQLTSCSDVTGNPSKDASLGKKPARQLWAQTGYLCWHRVGQVVILNHNWANVRTELKMYTSPKLPHNVRVPVRQQWQCNILNAGPLANLWLRRRLGIGAPHTKARSHQWDGTVLGTTMLHRKVRMMPSGMTQAFISTYAKGFGHWTKLQRKILKC